MEDVLAKIVEIDRRAQEITDEALELRRKAESSLETDKKKLRENYFARMRRRIRLTEETEEHFLAETLDSMSVKYAEREKKMSEIYDRNHDRWVAELCEKVLNG